MREALMWMEFLRECARTKGPDFDNSAKIPERLVEKYGHGVEVGVEWKNYLKNKFLFLMLSEAFPQEAERKVLDALTKSGKAELAELFSGWRDKAEAEEKAYLYRISQLPKAVVHAEWYCDEVEECYEWCKRRMEKLEGWRRAAETGGWHEKVAEVYRQIRGEPFNRLENEETLAAVSKLAIGGLKRRIDALQSTLVKSAVSFDDATGVLTQECQDVLGEIQRSSREGGFLAAEQIAPFESYSLADLALTLMKTLYLEGFNDTAVILRFLYEIKSWFPCEVCDFLDVEGNNEILVWRAATVDHSNLSPEFQERPPEELRILVQDQESYERGVGITGSILLLDATRARDIWSHIGSNDVLHDPRQSEAHRSAYESDMYPGLLKGSRQINNFWAFPIFMGSKLVGAFRVVNRTRDDGELQPGGWSYLTRVQLALVANWFSRFLEAAAPQLESKQDFIAFLERNRHVDDMARRLELDWMDKGILHRCLRHLTRDMGRKHEKRGVGCCLIVADTGLGGRAVEELPGYPLIDVNPSDVQDVYERLDRYHDAIDPLQGAYLFDQRGRFNRLARLSLRAGGTDIGGRAVLEAMTRQHARSVCLLLERDTKSVMVYRKGECVVEVHISESTGEWRFRYPGELLALMLERALNVEQDVIRIVYEASLEMSRRGLGGLFVVGKAPEEEFLFSLGIPTKVDDRVQDIGPKLLTEFAKLDGATFIDGKGFITRVNTTVRGKKPLERKLFPRSGARHEAGETITRGAPEALVIIISENRGISVAARGEIICENR